MWDVATGLTTRRLAGHIGKIHVVEFNEDASVVASGTLSEVYSLGPKLKIVIVRIIRLDR